MRMVTIITTSGSPIMISSAEDARVLDGHLVCLNSDGQRLLSFDPCDVVAFAVEIPGQRSEWIMGGQTLADAGKNPERREWLPWRRAGTLLPSLR
jgi:hypothetical protein